MVIVVARGASARRSHVRPCRAGKSRARRSIARRRLQIDQQLLGPLIPERRIRLNAPPDDVFERLRDRRIDGTE